MESQICFLKNSKLLAEIDWYLKSEFENAPKERQGRVSLGLCLRGTACLKLLSGNSLKMSKPE